MSNPTVNFGLIGSGRIGVLHAEHLTCRIPGARLLVVADINKTAACACADRFQVPACTNDYQKILEQRDIQAVVISSSTDTHARMIEEAAAAGKHIFCEKPIDFDLGRIDRALEAVKRAGVILQVGFNRRFDANFRRVRQAVAGGEIGEPHQLHIISRDPAPPPIEYIKKSGGIFADMTIHDFDMARFILDREPAEVYAAAGVLVDPAIGAAGDIDTAIITLKFARGVIATIDNCRQAVYGYDQRVEVLGSKGAIRTDNNYPNAAVVSDGWTVWRDLPLNFFMERYSESFLTEMRDFVACVLQDKPVPVTGHDARAAVVMALAARRSFELNRPVAIDEITDDRHRA